MAGSAARRWPGPPVQRFPRTDEGWAQAWKRYLALEPTPTEVGLGGPPTLGPPAATLRPARRITWAWWLLPILVGWIGGLVAWLLLKDTDRRVARNMLVVGIASSALAFILVYTSQPR